MTNQELLISLVLVLVISVLSLVIFKEPIYMLGTIPIFINFLISYENNYIRVSTIIIVVITSLFLFKNGGSKNDFN